MPLIVAPVLDMADLRAVRGMSVSYLDPVFDVGVKEAFEVSKVRWFNRTAVEFHSTTPGEGVRVWNGEASIFKPGYPSIQACAADVTCSSFKVNGAGRARDLENAAVAELQNMNFPIPNALRRVVSDGLVDDGARRQLWTCW